jgi:nicotinamidase-related amidase
MSQCFSLFSERWLAGSAGLRHMLLLGTFTLSQAITTASATVAIAQDGKDTSRVYHNQLRRIESPKPLLADYPEYFEPIIERVHYEAPAIVTDDQADLHVRAWRFSYNARGIVEAPNHLRADKTAVIMVHPWGIDDGQGWQTPEPAGVVDFCTPEKNQLAAEHTARVIRPLIDRLRPRVSLVMYSLPGLCDPIRRKLYRSFDHNPTADERAQGARELAEKLKNFDYRGQPIVDRMELSSDRPVIDYFKQFPGLDAGARYNNKGFWDLPIPVTQDIQAQPNDVVICDAEGYPALRDFLIQQKIRHVLLVGYATDMCFCKTTAGYEYLSKDFNVFLVGDASLATFPSNATPRFAVNAAISYAALNQLITQVSWIQLDGDQTDE